jgi:hypothetical protein
MEKYPMGSIDLSTIQGVLATSIAGNIEHIITRQLFVLTP